MAVQKRKVEPMSAEERAMYDIFSARFTNCMVCGIDPKRQIRKHFPTRWLECAHILGGHGQRKQKGETDRRNLLMLCKLCHDLAHHKNYRKPDRTLMPYLDRENLLWLKQKHDPDHFDLDFLAKVARQAMPVPVKPYALFQQFLEMKTWDEE